MENIRVWFQKIGAAKYISHLDLTRCMARALKLSGLPLWYTQGFNPRIYMTFAMPLSLGVSGERECMDIRFTQPVDLAEASRKLAACLPEDIVLLEVARPEEEFSAIAYGDYRLRLEAEDPRALLADIENVFAQEQVIVMKRTKKGEKPFNIKPHFQFVEKSFQPGWLLLDIFLPCSQEGSVNPGFLAEALQAYTNREPYVEITRKRLLKKDFSDMR